MIKFYNVFHGSVIAFNFTLCLWMIGSAMKNVVKLDHYFAPEELEAALKKFVYRYNNERYHESLNNLTPADVYFGRGESILKEREKLKKIAIINRRNEYQRIKLTTNQQKHLSLNY